MEAENLRYPVKFENEFMNKSQHPEVGSTHANFDISYKGDDLSSSWMAIDIKMGSNMETKRWYLSFDFPVSYSIINSSEVNSTMN